MKKLNNYTIVGKIINTRGIKGDLKIAPQTSFIDRFSNLDLVYVGEDLIPMEIVNSTTDNKHIFLRFKGYNNINDVLKFKNMFLYVKDEDRVPLKEGNYYISDIIGFKIFNTENIELGELSDVIDNPANDLFVLKRGSKEFLIPAVSSFVKDINLDEKKIIIDPIEGLID